MSKQLQISKPSEKGKKLSKEQKRFNRLVERITHLRRQIEVAKELDLELRKIGEERVSPSERLMAEAKREWVLLLHNHPHRPNLKKKMQARFQRIMLTHLGDLLDFTFFNEDQELRALYQMYEYEGRSIEEVRAEEAKNLKAEAAEMAKKFYDLDIDPDDFENIEKLQEIFAAKQAAIEAEAAQRAEKKVQKPKSEAQLAAEAQKEAVEKSVKKTTKQLYLELVHHFHPDKEPDEQKRLEKTEVMKEITAAYDADDHLKLLELQIQFLNKEQNVFENFDDSQLRFFNNTLERQVYELEEEKYQVSPEGNGNIYGMLYVPDRRQMLARIEGLLHEHKRVIKELTKEMRVVKDPGAFEQFVRTYYFEGDSF